MGVEDVQAVLATLRELGFAADADLGYYAVLAGFTILGAFALFAGASLALRGFRALLNATPEGFMRGVLGLGVLLVVIGVLLP